MSGPRIGELFAGYGGLGMGVKAVLGGEVAWYSDVCKFDKDGNAGHYDPHRGPCRIWAHRHPEVPNIGDITQVDWSQVEPVDILTGGFPCQDVSAAGKRAGIRPGTRSGLWTHFAYAIDQLRPRLVVIENVRGLLSAEAHSDMEPCPWCLGDDADGVMRALGAVLGDLASLGFDAEWVGLRAADVGAPHGRFRVFIVAYPASDTGRLINGDDEAAGHASRLGRIWRETQLPRPLNEPAWDGTGSLLPTPTARDPKGVDAPGRRGGESLSSMAAHALLPTPRAGDGEKGGPNQRGSSGDLMLPSAVVGLSAPVEGVVQFPVDGVAGGVLPGVDLEQLPDVVGGLGGQGHGASGGHASTERRPGTPDKKAVTENFPLLPTPAVNDMGEGKTVEAWDEWTAKMKAAHGNGNGHGASLAIEAQRLLPTPTAKPENADDLDKRAARVERARGKHGRPFGESLSAALAQPAQWGQYADAIARWETLTRPAPPPTETGPKGNPRLSPDFSSWLMGLPAGWITDVPGVTRNEALKLAGNGVVPQQAEAALRFLLGVTEVAA